MRPMLRECLSAVDRLSPPPLEVIVAIDSQSPGIWEVFGVLGFHPVEGSTALPVFRRRGMQEQRVRAVVGWPREK